MGRRAAAGPAGREGDSAMMNKISGEVLALSPLSSKYYWRQFASQYLTKLIRSAVGGKRGHSRWRTPERIFCPIGRLESVYFNAIDRDGSVCLYCKQKLNKQRRTFECSEEIYLSRCGDIESLRALLSYAFFSGCYSFYSSA